MAQEIEIGAHWVKTVGGMQFNLDTIFTAWLAMILMIVFALIFKGRMKLKPGRIQTVAEFLMEFLEGIVVGQMGKEGYSHFALIGSLFLFILTSNLIGQLPWKLYHLQHGELASPTNDLNTTLALALIVSVYYFFVGIKKKGLSYFKHYLQPVWFMAPFNLLEDITKPVTLSLRLFANVFAGEVIVMVFIGLLPVFLPVPMMLFEIFVAFIQAFIFAILSATYIGMALKEEH